jgi:hypothetical protein
MATPISAGRQKDRPLVRRLPAEGSDPGLIRDYRDRVFNRHSAYRNRHMERMALSLLYQLSRQWVEPDYEVLIDSVRGFVFRDMRQASMIQMPRPVTNYIAPSVEVELASLGKRELTPKVLTTSNDPRIEAAAKVAQEVLDYRLKTLGWADIRELATFLTVVIGTSCIRSYWDETYSDLTPIGAPNAVACQQCGQTLASPNIPRGLVDQVPRHRETLRDMPIELGSDEASVQVTHCPTCEVPSLLTPMSLGPEEAAGTDMFGRSLGMLVPKGNTALEIVSPFDLYPENSGVGITPDNCRIWAQATTRSLDYFEERYPERFDEIEPEDPQELMRTHPILGEWSLIGRYDSAMDSGIYDAHQTEYSIHASPSYRFPKGRSIVMAGDVLLEDGPLLRELTLPVDPMKPAPPKTISVPRVMYGAARFKVRHGEFWGHGLVDDLISPQNRLNGLDAQMIEARERMGSPNLIVGDDMDLTGPEWNEEYGCGKIFRYQISPLSPNAKPEVFGAIDIPHGFREERADTIQDMKQVAGPQDVEIGEAPRNISTTSGLQLLGEAAERRRAPRERALVSMFEKIWSHQLQLVWVLRTEEDEYEAENDEGSWERKQFKGQALCAQTKVIVEKQAYIDKSLYQREGVREAQADMLYRLDSQLAIKKILEYRGLPTDVNEDLNRQVDIGKRQFVDFRDEGVIPTIDTDIDDFWIRFQVLGTMLLTDEGKRMEKAAMWPEITKLIAGWEDELDQMQLMDAKAVAFYGGRPSPEHAQPIYDQALNAYKQQEQQVGQQMATSEAMGEPIVPPPPLEPPPPPVFLPPAIEDQILMVWTSMIQRNGGIKAQPTMESMQTVQNFLKFRAVVSAYKRYHMKQQMKLMGGVPGAAAPGGTPGAEAVPATPPTQAGLEFQSPNQPQNPATPPPAPGM